MVGQRKVRLHGRKLDIRYRDKGTLDDISAHFDDLEFDHIECVTLSSEHGQVYTQPFLATFLRDLEVMPNLVALELSCTMDSAAAFVLASYLEQCSLRSVSFAALLHISDDTAAALFKSVATNDNIHRFAFSEIFSLQPASLSQAIDRFSSLLHIHLYLSSRSAKDTINEGCSLVSKIPQLTGFSLHSGRAVNQQLDIGPLIQQLAHNHNLKSLHLLNVCMTDVTAHQLQDLFRTVPIEEFCLHSRCSQDKLLAVLTSIESSSLTSVSMDCCTSIDRNISAKQTAIALCRALQCPTLEKLSIEESSLNITTEALIRALQHRSCALKELRLGHSGILAMGKGVDLDFSVFREIQRLTLDTTTEGYSAFFHHVGELPDLNNIRVSVVDPSQPHRLHHSLLHALQFKHIVSLGVLYPQSQEDLDRIREALLSNTSILQLFMTRKFTSDTTEAIRQILDRNRGLYFIQRNASLCALFTPHGKFASMRCLLDPRLLNIIRSYIPPMLPSRGHGITYVSQISQNINS